MKLFCTFLFCGLLIGLGGLRALAQDTLPTPEVTESSIPVPTSTPERPPDGYTLAEPGVYLYTHGEAVPLPSLGYIRSGSRLPEYVPQTTNPQPTLLVWSPDITPFQLTLNSFSGNVDIGLESRGNFLIVTRSTTAGIRPGATLWAVDGTLVGGDVEQAHWLLYGDAGSAVELTLFEGTEQQFVVAARQPRDRRTHQLNLSFWDERTVLFTPAFPLPFGIYCIYAGRDRCFEVVSELDPIPEVTVVPTPVLTECVNERGAVGVTSTRIRATPAVRGTVVIEIPLGTLVYVCGETANGGYLYVQLSDGTGGWVSKQTINLENRFSELPIVESFEANNQNGRDPSADAPTEPIPPTAVNAQIVIRSITGASDITNEAVELQNNGRTVELEGWTLSDTHGNVYTFRQQRLFSGGRLTLNTRAGLATPVVLFWGLNSPVWEVGDVGILRDGNGVVQSTFRITE